MGDYPSPRRRVNPALRAAVLASGQPFWFLAIAAGFTHASKFSSLLHASTVPATAGNLESLHRIAEAVNFPVEQLFLFDPEARP